MSVSHICQKLFMSFAMKKQKNFSVALVSNRKDKKYKDKNFKKDEIEFFKRDIANFNEEEC